MLIILLINLVFGLGNVRKMVKTRSSVSPKTPDNIDLYLSRRKLFKMTPVHVLFCPVPKDFRFPVIEKEINQEILTFNKLKSDFFFFYPFSTNN